MIVVSDTSVIISLIQIGQVEWMFELHGKVLIPRAVYSELIRYHSTVPTFIEICEVMNREMVARLEAQLDLGEAEAIVLAKERNADLLLIDEKLGRRVALSEGIRVSGLLALLVEAKREGFVKSVRDTVALQESKAGFRVSKAVKIELFRAANE